MRNTLLLVSALLAGVFVGEAPAAAQDSAADTANVLLDVARVLEGEQDWEMLERLLTFIVRHYPGTPAAEEAELRLAESRGVRTTTQGRTRFIVSQTLFGAWMGVAIPAALSADDAAPYGLGLLLGAPAGFIWSNAFSRSNPMSRGRANVISFSEWWGTWQGIGWQQVSEIGEDEYGDSDSAPFAAAVIGGLAGLGISLAATSVSDVREGQSEVISGAALWGSWYGLAIGVLADAEDDELLTWTLVGGDVGLLAAIPLGAKWDPSPGRTRLIGALGLAGGLAGLGVDLLTGVSDEKTGILIPMIGTTAGLALGFAVTAPKASQGESDNGALLNWDGEFALAVPLPEPAVVPRLTREGLVRYAPATKLNVVQLRF